MGEVNTKAWAENMLAFIAEHGLDQDFADWCGGWACPMDAVAYNEAIREAERRGAEKRQKAVEDTMEGLLRTYENSPNADVRTHAGFAISNALQGIRALPHDGADDGAG